MKRAKSERRKWRRIERWLQAAITRAMIEHFDAAMERAFRIER